MKKLVFLFFLIIHYSIKAKNGEIDSFTLLVNNYKAETSDDIKYKLVRKLLILSLKQKNKNYESESYRFLSEIFNNRANKDSALFYGKIAYKVSLADRNYKNLINNLNQIGRTYRNIQEYDSALKYFNHGLEYEKNIPNYEGLTSINQNIGIVYSQKQKYNYSMIYYLKSIQLAELNNDKDAIIFANYCIGYDYLDNKNYPKAETYLLKAIEDTINIKRIDKYYYSHAALGILYSRWSKFELSIKHYKIAQDYFSKINFIAYKADILNNLAVVYSKMGNIKNSIIYSKMAITESKNANNLSVHVGSILTLAATYEKTKNFIELTNLILPIAKDSIINVVDINSKGNIYYNLSLIYENKLNFRNSLIYYKKYKEVCDSVNNIILNSKTQEIETKYQTEKKQAEILTLQNKNLKESRIKWVLASILAISLIGLGLFFKLYKKIKGQKSIIENLQKELHHRIKNNLSIINKFIGDIKSKTNKDNIDIDLSDLQNKIESINTVHKQLYDTQGIQDIDLKVYIDTLSTNVSNTFNLKIDIQNLVDAKATVNIERIFPLGLIINEFMTNSFKHGFDNISNPTISIKSIVENNQLKQLEISDNGIGFKPNNQTKKSLGLRMINLLSRQMDSDIEFINQNGAKLILSFK